MLPSVDMASVTAVTGNCQASDVAVIAVGDVILPSLTFAWKQHHRLGRSDVDLGAA